MYLSDRQRVEISLPSQMMLGAFKAGVEDQGSEEFKSVITDLLEASMEPVSDLVSKKAAKIILRINSLLKDITVEYVKQDAEVSKVALITFHFMRFIIEDNYLQYEQGSAFDRSIQAFMEALEHKASEPRVNESAIKQAKKMLKRLQEWGYYRGVQINDC